MAEKSKGTRQRILKGYDRLAFGGISDAVQLLFCETPDVETLKKMDLFSVSEIKKQRDGGIEIKFFDRLKALQCMDQMKEEDQEKSDSFFSALRQGIRAFEADRMMESGV